MSEGRNRAVEHRRVRTMERTFRPYWRAETNGAVMSDFNSRNNPCRLFDIPVADLDRAQTFYAAMLGNQRCIVNSSKAIRFVCSTTPTATAGAWSSGKDSISATAGIPSFT